MRSDPLFQDLMEINAPMADVLSRLAQDDFAARPRKGDNTIRISGEACNSWRALATNDPAKQWMQSYGFNVSGTKTFACKLHGGHENAKTIAAAYAHFFTIPLQSAHPTRDGRSETLHC